MSRLSRLDRDQVEPASQQVYDRLLRQRGSVPRMFRTAAHHPAIFRTMVEHYQAVMGPGLLSDRLKELLVVFTSRLNRCPYCLDPHYEAALRLGCSPELLDGSLDPDACAQLLEHERLALTLAEKMTLDPHSIDDALWSKIRRHFSEAQIVEMLAVIGLYNYFNRFNDVLRMETTE